MQTASPLLGPQAPGEAWRARLGGRHDPPRTRHPEWGMVPWDSGRVWRAMSGAQQAPDTGSTQPSTMHEGLRGH